MKTKYVKTRTITDKVRISGELSADGKTITYAEDDTVDKTVSVDDVLKVFRGKSIDLAVSVKTESDLDDATTIANFPAME